MPGPVFVHSASFILLTDQILKTGGPNRLARNNP